MLNKINRSVGGDFSFGRTARIILYIVSAHFSALCLDQKYFILFSSIQNGLVITFAKNHPTASKPAVAAAAPFIAAYTNDISWKSMGHEKEQTTKPILINNASLWPILHGKWHVLNAIGRWFAKWNHFRCKNQINSICFFIFFVWVDNLCGQ